MIIGLLGEDPLFEFLVELENSDFEFVYIDSKQIDVSAVIAEDPKGLKLACPILTKSSNSGRVVLSDSCFVFNESPYFLIPSAPLVILEQVSNANNISREELSASVIWLRGGSSLGKVFTESLIQESVTILNAQGGSSALDQQLAFNVVYLAEFPDLIKNVFPNCSAQQYFLPVLNGEIIAVSIPATLNLPEINQNPPNNSFSLLSMLDKPEPQITKVSKCKDLQTVTFFVDNICFEAFYVLKTLSHILAAPGKS